MLLETDKDEKVINVLESLPVILEEIQPKNITHWVLQWVEIVAFEHLHFSSVQEIEKASSTDRGLMISNEEFFKFVAGLHQMLQGTIIALTDKDSFHPKFVLENFDSSQWLLETNDKEIIGRLIATGWVKSQHVPDRMYYDSVME